MSIHSIQDSNALLLYRVGPVLVCSATLPVEAVIMPPKYTAVPGSSDAEPGMFKSIHGMVRIVDLRVRFGVDKEDYNTPGRIIIAEVEGGRAGFWVDEIGDVSHFPETGWKAVPSHIPKEVFSRTLITDKKIRLYADFDGLDKFKSSGYLRRHIEKIKEDRQKKEQLKERQLKERQIKERQIKEKPHQYIASSVVKMADSGAAEKIKGAVGAKGVGISVDKPLRNSTDIKKEKTQVPEKLVPTQPEIKSGKKTQVKISKIKKTEFKKTEFKKTGKNNLTENISAKNNASSVQQKTNGRLHKAKNLAGSVSNDIVSSNLKPFDLASGMRHEAKTNEVKIKDEMGAYSQQSVTKSRVFLVWAVVLVICGYLFIQLFNVPEFNEKEVPEGMASEKIIPAKIVPEKAVAEKMVSKEIVSENSGVENNALENSDLYSKPNKLDSDVVEGEASMLKESNGGAGGLKSELYLRETTSLKEASLDEPDEKPEGIADSIELAAAEEQTIEKPQGKLFERPGRVKLISSTQGMTIVIDEFESSFDNEAVSADKKNHLMGNHSVKKQSIEHEKIKFSKSEIQVENSNVNVGEADNPEVEVSASIIKEKIIDRNDEKKAHIEIKIENKVPSTEQQSAPLEKTVNNKKIKSRRYIHVVVKGDTLWHIARRYVNNPWRYPELAKLSKIKNPDLIYPGNKIIIIINSRVSGE